MEALARELEQEINDICIGYHYCKDINVIERGMKLSEKIQQLSSLFLQGNIFEVEEEEYIGIQNYVIQMLKDYTEAMEQHDMVLMIDTLDYGVRELLNIFTDTNAAEETDEKGKS